MSHAPDATASVAASSHAHADVTAGIPRKQGRVGATIVDLRALSRSVRQITLEVAEADIDRARFMPGQWVDFYAPTVPMIGGYSICTTPRTLRTQRRIELAVKRSTHPPATWVHDQAKVGDHVEIEVGGEFVYDPAGEQQQEAALFIIGGVGITPLISMIRQRMEARSSEEASPPSPPTTVLYCAKEALDLVYRSDLESFSGQSNFHLYLSATGGSSGAHAEHWLPSEVNAGRLPPALLEEVLDAHRGVGHVYLCGPPSMVDGLLPVIEQTVGKDRVHFERWW